MKSSEDRRMIRRENLDVVGELFGLTFEDDEQVTLWVEDDEIWFSEITFSQEWLSDLQSTAWEGLRAWARRKVVERKQP
jgi:hypothetical protein